MQVDLKTLVAMTKCAASKDPARPFLEGLHVITRDDGHVHFEATSGVRLLMYRTPNVEGVHWDFTIPASFLERFKFGARTARMANLAFDTGVVAITHGDVTQTVGALDYSFPPVERALPQRGLDVERAPAEFKAADLTAFETFAKAIDAGSVMRVTSRGKDPALVTFGRPDVQGLLMPLVYKGDLEPPLRLPF